jgi:hypothetical protein
VGMAHCVTVISPYELYESCSFLAVPVHLDVQLTACCNKPHVSKPVDGTAPDDFSGFVKLATFP